MNVGGDCVSHYEIDVSVAGKSRAQIEREATILRRKSLLEAEFPGIDSMVWGWGGHLDRYEVIIPASLEAPYLALGQQVRRIYDDFIESQKIDQVQLQRDAEAIEKLRELLTERRELTTRMSQHVSANRGLKFAAYQYYVSWVQHHDQTPETTIPWLKEDGKIMHRTLFRLAEPRLMKAIAQDINRIISPAGFRVAQVDPDKRGYVLAPRKQRGPRVNLFTKHHDFLLRYGDAVLGEPGAATTATIEELLSLSTAADLKSIYEVWGAFVPLLDRQNIVVTDMSTWRLDFDQYFPEIIVHQRGTDKHVLIGNLGNLVDNFKVLAFKVGSKTPAQLAQAILDPAAPRYSSAQLREMYEERRERAKVLGR